MHSLRRAVCALLAGVVLLAACGKSEPPPPAPKAEPPKPVAPTVNADLKRLAAEVYVFAFPLVLTDVTRAVETAGLPPDTFRHTRALPDAKTSGPSPNADFLYSQAWLDLSNGPVILSVPDTKARYYLIAILDAWTNVAGSLGKRTTGTEKGEFAIVGPTWKGALPGGVSEVRSPTDLTWLFARIQTNGGGDIDAAARVQNDLKLRPLKAPAKPTGKSAAPPAATAAAADVKTPPRDQVAAMDAATFYTRTAMLLAHNPPAADDTPMKEKMTKLGITPGKPFDMSKLDAISVQSIQEGAKSAIEAIMKSAKSSGGEMRNGWTFDAALGRWGTDYGKRAVAAYTGIGLNAPEDAIFMATDVDAEGHKLEGTNRYVMHFDNKTLPPVDGFWSLSVYDEQRHFVANPQNRNNLGSTSHLAANPDGSIDIFVQSAAPGADKSANWLPAPSGRFNVILRLYWPKAEVVERRWVPPGIRKEKAG